MKRNQSYFASNPSSLEKRHFDMKNNVLLLVFIIFLGKGCSTQDRETGLEQKIKEATQEITVLGIAQDAGYPQINCNKSCCIAAYEGRREKQRVTSLGLVDKSVGKFWIFEASPDFPSQLQSMKEKYPEEMTIVVQHQFWDLKTTDTGFSIGLSFNEIPETLGVPYSAIRGFFDPAVQFGLQFDATDEEAEAKTESLTGPAKVSALPSPDEPAKAAPKKSKPKGDSEEKADVEEADDDDAGSADVVSLDAFRKK